MPTYSPDQYARRDQRLLAMVANERILLARCAAAALAAGKPLTHAVNRLVDGGYLLRHERILPGGLTVYTLTPTAAARHNLPRDRSELPAPAALDTALAVQCFAHLGRHPRYRLSTEDVSHLFQGAAPANVVYVVSAELGKPTIFRTLLTANRSPTDSVRYLRTLVDQAQRHPELGRWLAARQLGFALLAPTKQHVTVLQKAVARTESLRQISIIVDVGPDAEHLAATLKAK